MTSPTPAGRAAETNGLAHGLCVLAVDDELPALEELAYLLGRNEHVEIGRAHV